MPNSKGIERNKIEEIQNHQPKPLQDPKLDKSSNHNQRAKYHSNNLSAETKINKKQPHAGTVPLEQIKTFKVFVQLSLTVDFFFGGDGVEIMYIQ